MLISSLLFAALVACLANAAPSKPHIVWLVIDDVGWGDVSIRNRSNDILTPTLDSLADSGVLLDRYYTMPVCSPTRASLMLGRYAWKTGLQQYATLMPTTKAKMAYDQPTMAELLKEANYTTHAVGKWHLGYSQWAATPTHRGFDSHRGYFQGEIDYYNKSFAVPKKFLPFPHIEGLDWWDGERAVKNESGVYNKLIYDKVSAEIIANYNVSNAIESPLFLYYAHQLAHVPLDNPPQGFFTPNCLKIANPMRRVYCAMMAALDDSVQLLVENLKKKAIWNDTVLIITTDNGGMPNVSGGFPDSAGSNYPLRAGKGLCFEGGVRGGVAIVNGGLIPRKKRGTINSDLISAVDWYATSANLAGVKTPSGIDSLDLWDALINDQPLNRTNLPINLNYHVQYPNSGMQVGVIGAGNFKLTINQIVGPVLNYDGWFDNNQNYEPPPPNLTPGHFLFNLTNDPNERINLFSAESPISQQIELLEYVESLKQTQYMPPQINKFHPLGAPILHDGTWAPWEL